MARFKLKKPPPALSRADFYRLAKPKPVKVDRVPMGDLKPREWKTGSIGWWQARRMYVEIGGRMFACQLNVSLIIAGSAGIPPDDTPAPQFP